MASADGLGRVVVGIDHIGSRVGSFWLLLLAAAPLYWVLRAALIAVSAG